MDEDNSITFRSRVSVGLVVVVYVVWGVTFAVNMAVQFSWITAAILLAVFAFVSDIFFNMRYVIRGHNLYIRSGMFSESNIDIKSVYKIKRTKSLESAPAASLRRLKMCYGKRRYVIISPRDEDEFVKALLSINPEIEVNI